MKIINKTIMAFVMLVSLYSCAQKTEFVSKPFVMIAASSYAYNEDAGTVKIPVYAYSQVDGKVSLPRPTDVSTDVSFEIINDTAEKDVHFTVSPANGVLKFDGASEAYIEININNMAGIYTSNVKFSIALTGATNGYTLGGGNSASVTIKDLDHPLANILGTYKTDVLADVWGDEYVITTTIEPTDEDIHTVTISNICPYSLAAGYPHKFVGVISKDRKTLTIESNQWIVEGALLFLAFDLTGEKPASLPALVLTIDEEAHTLTAQSSWGAITSSGYYDLLPGSGFAVFTKQ